MIYIFTDGYADQFGGPDGKKFMTKRFKDTLLSIHQKPAPEQEAALEKALNDWKKDISQVDDILVLGIRI
jgi:serine phosphatase RsbU (regulator of sigma subunit)